MPLAKERELIAVSSQAHRHLKDVVKAMKRNGIPTSGTSLASELILSIPIPKATIEQPKRRARKEQGQQPAALPA